ncbi:DNA primase [Virgibacillus halodenitrificans]|uniref:DNA primase n=1 Tax=Virgibacillus halodenitrificans TaxID=1482 RepID=UPI0024C0B919|nr:DNA primase [Virgibacillus halodenitrificans]WHX27532.1 DNA primase [Virgibacillus halodenitrificans]
MAKQIPEEMIEEIRNANDIVDVIGDYVQLKKQGRNYFGLCPFHGENTPSFSVTQEKQIFHCFGCGKGGNVVTFLMELENYSFYEALQYLAKRVGKDLPEATSGKTASISSENQSILSAYEWLTKLYHHLLRYTKDGKEGYSYFQSRNVSDHAIDEFQLGFAPNIKDFTAEFLKKKGFHQQLLVKAGLVSLQDDNSVTDRFRGRVIFPIRNHLGQTVGFGGRSLGSGEPKYLNSPESELFQKGRLLYNFDLAKKHIRKESRVIIFEGYMDVISAYQAGIKNSVATLGTALTEYQAKLINRYVDTSILCYDADKAGLEATYKAANLLLSVGSDVKIAQLKDGKDPDDFIREYGAEAFENEVIRSSDTFMAFMMRYLKKDFNLSLEGDRIDYVEAVLKQLALIESSIEREYYLKELSVEFNLSIETLAQEINTLRENSGAFKDNTDKKSYTNTNGAKYKRQKLMPAYYNAERQLISYMLQDGTIADKVREEIGASFNLEEHKIIVTFLYAFYEEEQLPDVSLFIERLDDPNLRKMVSEIAITDIQRDISDQEINDYIRIIRAESQDKANIISLKEQQIIAEKQSDPIRAAQILSQIIEMQKQMKNTY